MEHHMKTRSEIDKYKVDMANTERLWMSAGIQMQVTAKKYTRNNLLSFVGSDFLFL